MSILLDKITAKLDLLYLKEEDFKLTFKKKIGGAAFDKYYKEHLLKWKISDYKQLNKKKQEEFWKEFQENWDKHPEAEGLDEAESGDQEAYQKFFQAKLKKYGVKSPAELDDEKKKKFFDEIEKGWKGKDESTKINELSTPDKHQLKIAIDSVKNPMKGKFLGGPTAEEAEEILRKKFKYTDAQIKKLKESTDVKESASLNESKNFKEGAKLKISKYKSSPGKGLSYPDFEAIALEDGAIGSWDVYDVKSKSGKEESVYGFSITVK